MKLGKKESLIVKFFGLTFLITWIPWFIAVISKQKQGDFLVNLFIALGGIGPTVAALIMLYKNNELNDLKKDYWKRVLNFKAIKIKYYLIIFFLPPVVYILSIMVTSIFESRNYQFIGFSNSSNSISGIISFIIFTLIFGPIPEELGWRGIGLDLLTTKFNRLKASLILAFIWALWHIPLFFINGTYQNTKVFYSFGTFIYVGGLFCNTFILTWLYYKTNKRILAAILYHFMINYTGLILNISEFSQLFSLFLLSIIIIVSIKKEKNFWLEIN